jgi:hypothetical protein
MNHQKTTHGGARKGSGRKPGKPTKLAGFNLYFDTVERLKVIPPGQRSKFVDQAICAALSKA